MHHISIVESGQPYANVAENGDVLRNFQKLLGKTCFGEFFSKE